HRAQHVHRPDRMADDLGLFAHRKVRLIVFVGSGPILGRVVAARDRFLGEIMRGLAPALVDEVAGKVEPALISGQPVELIERELDLLMAGVAALLAGPCAERRGDMVDVSLHDVEEAAAAGDAEVGDRAFQEVAGVVKLMIVAQVGPALPRLAAVVPAVEIAVGRLRRREVLDDRVDFGLDVGIAPMRERVSSRLDPFADVRVPEHLHGEAVVVARHFERRDGLRQFQRFEDADFRKFGVLARNGALEHDLQPLAPERAGEPDFRERDRGIAASSHGFNSPPKLLLKRAPQDSLTTSEQGSRRTPATAWPDIISSRHSPAARPSASRFMSTLVRGGLAPSAMTSQLSNPTMATSAGTERPISRKASMIPRAIWSLPQKTASGGGRLRAKRRWTASRPHASDQSPARQSPLRA